MSDARFAQAIFCDDIRLELGNKYSLMGIYNGDMFLSELPAFLPRLAVSMFFHYPSVDRPIVRFKVFKGDEVVVDLEAAGHNVPSIDNPPLVGQGHDVPTRRFHGFNAFLPALSVSEPCMLRAVVIADGVEYMAGKLRIGPVPSV